MNKVSPIGETHKWLKHSGRCASTHETSARTMCTIILSSEKPLMEFLKEEFFGVSSG